jgi:hypothetical protein
MFKKSMALVESRTYQTKLTDTSTALISVLILLFCNLVHVRTEKMIFFISEVLIFITLSELYQFIVRTGLTLNMRKFIGPGKGILTALLCSIPFGFSTYTYIVTNDWYSTGSVFADYYFKEIFLVIFGALIFVMRHRNESFLITKLGVLSIFIGILESLLYQLFQLNLQIISTIGLIMTLAGVLSAIGGILAYELLGLQQKPLD